MSRAKPAIFVSSTCYDLKHLRSEIKTFITGYGFDALFSEFDSFPVIPGVENVENCLQVVRNNASMFILIVGGRYGSIDSETDKSITNLEYLEAEANGIPILCFVDKRILAILPIWKDNPTGNFQQTVDSPKLFNFVQALQSSKHGNIWIRPFETGEDIISALRSQWAFLFSEGLSALRRERDAPSLIVRLTGKARTIALRKPPGWECLLFAHLLKAEVEQRVDLRRDLRYSITDKQIDIEAPQELIAIWKERSPAIMAIPGNITRLLEVATTDGFGAPGEPGDIEVILYTARQYGKTFEEAILWGKTWLGLVGLTPRLQKVIDLAPQLTRQIIEDMHSFAVDLPRKIEESIQEARTSRQNRTVEFHLNLDVPDGVSKALNRAIKDLTLEI